jgi:hypothetical protein
MAREWIRPLLGLGLAAIGMAVAPIAARVRSRGWLGILVAWVAALFWLAASRTGVFGLLLIYAFLLIAPVSVLYSFRCEIRAPDRAAAGVAFVSSFILGALLLVTVAALVQSLWITRPGSPNHTTQRMGASRSAGSESLSQWRLAPHR